MPYCGWSVAVQPEEACSNVLVHGKQYAAVSANGMILFNQQTFIEFQTQYKANCITFFAFIVDKITIQVYNGNRIDDMHIIFPETRLGNCEFYKIKNYLLCVRVQYLIGI